jgi:hypothetical protein
MDVSGELMPSDAALRKDKSASPTFEFGIDCQGSFFALAFRERNLREKARVAKFVLLPLYKQILSIVYG